MGFLIPFKSRPSSACRAPSQRETYCKQPGLLPHLHPLQNRELLTCFSRHAMSYAMGQLKRTEILGRDFTRLFSVLLSAPDLAPALAFVRPLCQPVLTP